MTDLIESALLSIPTWLIITEKSTYLTHLYKFPIPRQTDGISLPLLGSFKIDWFARWMVLGVPALTNSGTQLEPKMGNKSLPAASARTELMNWYNEW